MNAVLLTAALALTAPILDAHVYDTTGAHIMAHAADWQLGPDNPATVQFVAQNTGLLVSIELRLAANRWYESPPAQPVAVSLWHGEEQLGQDAAPASAPFVWTPPAGPLKPGLVGYNPYAFVFPGVDLAAGETYEFRATAPDVGTWLLTDSLSIFSPGNIDYRVWVELPTLLLPGDADGSGVVDLADFGILKNNFGLAGAWSTGDFSGDGRVDISDFGILKDNLGRTAGTTVPEPSGLWLGLVAAGLAYLMAGRQSRAAMNWSPPVTTLYHHHRCNNPRETRSLVSGIRR